MQALSEVIKFKRQPRAANYQMDVETQLWRGEENHEMVIRLAESRKAKRHSVEPIATGRYAKINCKECRDSTMTGLRKADKVR